TSISPGWDAIIYWPPYFSLPNKIKGNKPIFANTPAKFRIVINIPRSRRCAVSCCFARTTVPADPIIPINYPPIYGHSDQPPRHHSFPHSTAAQCHAAPADRRLYRAVGRPASVGIPAGALEGAAMVVRLQWFGRHLD